MRRFLSGSNIRSAALNNCSLGTLVAGALRYLRARCDNLSYFNLVFLQSIWFSSMEARFSLRYAYNWTLISRSCVSLLSSDSKSEPSFSLEDSRIPARLFMKLLAEPSALLKAHYSYMQRLAHTLAKHSHMRMRTFVTSLLHSMI